MFRLISLLMLAVTLAGIAAIAILIYRPAAILGVSGPALAHSLLGEVGRADLDGSCAKAGGDDQWRCTIKRSGGSLEAGFRVSTHDHGCWDAKRTQGREGSGVSVDASACINILDYVRVF